MKKATHHIKEYQIFVSTGQWKPKVWWLPKKSFDFWSGQEMKEEIISWHRKKEKPPCLIVIQLFWKNGEFKTDCYYWNEDKQNYRALNV